MSYTWENGELITAEKLNSTGGDDSSVLRISVNNSYLNKTWNEINNALSNGIIPIVYNISSATDSIISIINRAEIYDTVYRIYALGYNDVFGYIDGNPDGYPYIID